MLWPNHGNRVVNAISLYSLSTYCVPGLVLHLGANVEPPTHPVCPLMPVFLPCFCLVA